MSPRRAEYQEKVSYSQAHLRLKKDRGPAARHLCVTCGSQAREWAYKGGCPNELFDLGKHYSTDQSRYEPMCVPCHRRHDRALADGRSPDFCPHGHEWSVENTGIRRSRKGRNAGLRFCKACHRERSREYHQRNIRSRV